MKTEPRQSGLTLTEMVVVIAAVAMLTGFSMPAVRTFFSSMATSGGTRAVISAALASARAIAAREQRYAGVRFQQNLDGNQYMIFIVHDPQMNPSQILANGFRAVEGLKPIKLPDGIGVMDLKLGTNGDVNISLDTDISDNWQLTDTTTFSIIFSPSGKMVIQDVRVRNRDGQRDTSSVVSYDDIFNKKIRVDAEFAMFYQDDYYPGYAATPDLGLGPELSRNSFVIYDKIQFDKIAANRRWFDYLYKLVPEIIYINPYTGTIINK